MQPMQFARIRKLLPHAIAALTILLCVVSTAYSLRLIFRAYHGAILWDEWDSIDFFDRLRQGTVTFHDFIRQHNEHRILFPRLVFALDLALTDARNTINLASILVCQVLHVLLFHRLISIGAKDRLLKWTLTAFVTLMLFSIVQKENFVWAFQIQFVGVFLFFTLAASTLSAAQASAGGTRWPSIAAGFFFGAGAALVMSNGVAALICIAIVFAAARLFNRLTAAIALCGFALLLCYAATFTPNPGHTPLGFAAQHPLIFIQYVGVYLGCVFAPLGLKAAFLAGALGLAVTGTALLALFTGRIERNRVNLTLTAILVFVALTATLTGVGRSSFGLAQAASSRYATPSAIFWAAAVTLTALWLSDRGAQRLRTLPALALVSGITLISVIAAALVQYEFRYQGRIRVVDMARASDAILSSVYDVSALQVLFPDIELMKVRIPILKADRLNIFSGPQPWPLGTVVPATRLAEGARCLGALDLVEPVPGIADAFQLKGWAWDVGAGRPPERLVVLSAQQGVIGYGSSGWPRADVPAAVPGVHNHWVGWTAFARGPGGQLSVYGALSDGSLCRVGTKPVP